MNQQQFRVDFYNDVMNHLNQNYELNDIENTIIVFLFIHVENFKYMKIKKQNVLILIRTFDEFIFFYFHLQFKLI